MTGICFLLVSLASPKEITSAAIVNAVRSGEARAYADAIEQNIETIKNSDEALILIQEPPKTPELFTTDEIETWRFGTAEYYGKNKIRYYSLSNGYSSSCSISVFLSVVLIFFIILPIPAF